MTWHTSRMAPFDTETTSSTPEVARIVSACVALVGDGKPPQIANWMADPGVPIPEEAAKIHGITTERAQAEGRPAPEVIEQVIAALAQAVTAGIPVVAMNARYDFTVLDREARRHNITPLTDLVGDQLRVIDPYILDKHVDTYRAGKRTLTHLCQHYRVRLDGAHDAAADAIGAARVAWRIGSLYPAVRDLDLDGLHKQQTVWAAEQAASLQEHLRRKHPNSRVEGAWPLVPVRDGDQETTR